ncbi:MAG: hypothetical protein H0U04_04685 [Rubrobacter sp.]|nr:hypothetical protein [Rubrobacter sp.]
MTSLSRLADQKCPCYDRDVETVSSFYGPWLGLMFWIGLLCLLLGTPALFLFERRSFLRWLVGRIDLFGLALVLLSVALRIIIRVLEEMFTNLPGA